MPIHEGTDSLGKYYQYGGHGKRYYFFDNKSKKEAYTKAKKQAAAIHMKSKD